MSTKRADARSWQRDSSGRARGAVCLFQVQRQREVGGKPQRERRQRRTDGERLGPDVEPALLRTEQRTIRRLVKIVSRLRGRGRGQLEQLEQIRVQVAVALRHDIDYHDADAV